jgi:hypothetical protein
VSEAGDIQHPAEELRHGSVQARSTAEAYQVDPETLKDTQKDKQWSSSSYSNSSHKNSFGFRNVFFNNLTSFSV